VLIHIDLPQDILLEKNLRSSIPAFFSSQEPLESSMASLLEEQLPIYRKLADIIMQFDLEFPEYID
jgi:shikimate kinase